MSVRTKLEQAWHDGGRVPPLPLALGAVLAQSLLSRKKGGALSRLAGLALGLGSTALLATAAAGFARRGTTLDPVTPGATTLVTDGPNALTRNPMYTGIVGILLARAVARRSVLALVPAVVVAWLLDSRQIPAEEAVLAERFGSDWETYRDSTPRWVDARSVQRLRQMAELEELPWFTRRGAS